MEEALKNAKIAGLDLAIHLRSETNSLLAKVMDPRVKPRVTIVRCLASDAPDPLTP